MIAGIAHAGLLGRGAAAAHAAAHRGARDSSSVARAARQLLDRAAVKITRREIHVANGPSAAKHVINEAQPSNNCCQSMSAIRRMLVMMLRTVTFDGALAVVLVMHHRLRRRAWVARRWSSQVSAGVTFGS